MSFRLALVAHASLTTILTSELVQLLHFYHSICSGTVILDVALSDLPVTAMYESCPLRPAFTLLHSTPVIGVRDNGHSGNGHRGGYHFGM